MRRFITGFCFALFISCGGATVPGVSTPLRSNLADFQGTYCDQGNYGSLWELLTWAQSPKPYQSKISLRLEKLSSTLHVSRLGREGQEETLSYEYKAPYLWVQRHFEVSGWPQQFWMRLAVNEQGLVIAPPEEELSQPLRIHRRATSKETCVSD